MSRYIDADEYVTVLLYDDEREEEYTERMTIAESLDSFTDDGCPQTIDAVSVVRCRDCKNAFNVEGEWICNHLSGMVGLNVVVNADDFCSYGEREGE